MFTRTQTGHAGIALLILILLICLILSGCVAMQDTYRNPDTGQKFTCKMLGVGVVGVAISAAEQAQCIHDAKARGYTEAQ